MQSAPLWLMKPTLPRARGGFAKVAFKPMCGIITPRQFGPMMRIGPRASADLLFQLAPAVADLLEAGGDDDRAFHAGRDALAHGLRNGRGFDGDDGEINCGRHVADLRERPLTKNGVVCGIYRKEPFA